MSRLVACPRICSVCSGGIQSSLCIFFSFAHLFQHFPGHIHGSHALCMSRCSRHIPRTCLLLLPVPEPSLSFAASTRTLSVSCAELLVVRSLVVTIRYLSFRFRVATGWKLSALARLYSSVCASPYNDNVLSMAKSLVAHHSLLLSDCHTTVCPLF